MLVAATVLIAFLTGCNKDTGITPEQTAADLTPTESAGNYPISLIEAMARFRDIQGLAPENLSGGKLLELVPEWSQAYTGQTLSGKEVVVVPLPDSHLVHLNHGRVGARLLLSKAGQDSINAEILVYIADSAYYLLNNGVLNFNTFSGLYLFFDIEQNFRHGIQLTDGLVSGKVTSITSLGQSNIASSRADCFTYYFITRPCDQALYSCIEILSVTIQVVNCGGSDDTGGGGSSGNGGGGGGNGGGGGGGDTTSIGSGGGGASTSTPSYFSVLSGSVPINIFLASGGTLPPGFDNQLFIQFVEIYKYFNFNREQVLWLEKNPDFIRMLYGLIPENPVVGHGEQGLSDIKALLNFAMAYKINAEQFEFLAHNPSIFQKFKDLPGLFTGENSAANLSTIPKHVQSVINLLERENYSEDAQTFVDAHLNQMNNDVEYLDMVSATFLWPPIIWTIAAELISDKAIDIVFAATGLNKADEIRDAIKAISHGDWLGFTFEAGKIAFSYLPVGTIIKILDIAETFRGLKNTIDKIYDLVSSIGITALERAWNILKNSPIKFNANALKYVEDVKIPTLGAYFSTVSTYNSNFKNKFSDIQDKIGEVHHALPQAVQNKYPYFNVTNDQMHSLENLRGIPNDGSLDHTAITNYWLGFYYTNPNASFQEVMDFVKFIDDEFGHLFVPPVR